MPQRLDEIRQLVSEKKDKEAVEVLLALLKNGDSKLYQNAQKLATKKRAKAGKNDPKDQKPEAHPISGFLNKLTKNHKDLLSFLENYELGKKAFEQQKWSEAKGLLTSALEFHKDSFEIQKSTLEKHIKICKNGLQMKVHLQAGTQSFKDGKWEDAKKSYELALKLYQPGFPFPKEKITGSIQACENGKQYEFLVGKARHWMTLENWYEAHLSFIEARKLYRRGFVPEISMVDYEISLCKEALKDDEKSNSTGLIGELRNNPIFILLFIGVLLVCTIAGAYIVDFNKVSPAAYSKSTKDSIEAVTPLVPDLEEEIIAKKEGEDSVSQKVKKKAPVAEVVSIAVLPFCETDPILKAVCDNVYNTVNSRIKEVVQNRYPYYNQAAVMSHIRRARIRPDQVCQQKHTAHIAQSLNASRLFVGEMNRKDGGEMELVYRIYSKSKNSFQPGFSIKGDDMQEIMAKLPQALGPLLK